MCLYFSPINTDKNILSARTVKIYVDDFSVKKSWTMRNKSVTITPVRKTVNQSWGSFGFKPNIFVTSSSGLVTSPGVKTSSGLETSDLAPSAAGRKIQ